MIALIVDDEENIRLGIKENVDWQTLDFQNVLTASNGQEALNLIDNNNIDIVITDIKMPEISGLELARLITEKDSRTQIIILSGYSDFDYARRALEMDVISYHLKPVNIGELSETIRTAAEKVRRFDDQVRNQLEHLTLEKEAYLDRLLDGQSVSDDVHEDAINSHFGFSEKGEVLLFVIDIEKGNAGAIRRSLDQQLGEIQHVSHEKDGFLIYICKITEAVDLSEHNIRRIYKSINTVSEITLAWGGKGTWSQLHQLYVFAVQQLDRRLYLGCRQLLVYEALPISRNWSFSTENQPLKESIRRNDLETSKYIIKSELSNLKKEECTIRHLVRNQCFAYKNILLETVGWKDKETSVLTSRNLSRSSAVPILITIDEYIEWILDIYDLVFSILSTEKGPKPNSAIGGAYIYLKEHFAEDLNVSMLAELVQLSPDYFSRTFKKEMGISFSRYLNQIRIEEAKKLFKETNLLAYEIADRVGFRDYKYFVQVFKKLEGISPSKIRT